MMVVLITKTYPRYVSVCINQSQMDIRDMGHPIHLIHVNIGIYTSATFGTDGLFEDAQDNSNSVYDCLYDISFCYTQSLVATLMVCVYSVPVSCSTLVPQLIATVRAYCPVVMQAMHLRLNQYGLSLSTCCLLFEYDCI